VGAFVLALGRPAFSDEDVLVIKNGDRMTGEVDKLAGGDLHFDADYGESLFVIDWAEVERIESKENFVFETSRGRRYSGSFRTDPDNPEMIFIAADTGEVSVPASEIVSILPVETDFLGRLGFDVAFGYSFTKANSTQQINLRSSASYLEEAWQAEGRFDTLRNLTDTASNTRRTSFGGSFRRFLTDRWFALGLTSFLQSDEQQLDLRTSVFGGAGRFLVRTNRLYLATLFGAGWTNERYQDPDVPRTNSAEALGGLQLNAFDIGDLDLATNFVIYPNLSNWGRVRFDFDVDMRWEIVSDLFFGVGYFHNFDSEPLTDAPKNDFGVTTSIGWSF
jgi:putative salt-induced outer membrane protein YdiY